MYIKTWIDKLVGWARVCENTTFAAGREEIPLLASQRIHSLGCTYATDLSDRKTGETVRKQLADDLARINHSQLQVQGMKLPVHTKGDVAAEDELSPLVGGRQDE